MGQIVDKDTLTPVEGALVEFIVVNPDAERQLVKESTPLVTRESTIQSL